MRINLVPVLLSLITIFNLSTIAESATTYTSTSFNTTSQWLHFPTSLNQPTIELSILTILSAVLSFFAASISSAGGIGGGGLFISIMTIVAGLELKTASSFSAFMVTGVSVANVGCNLLVRNPKSGEKTLIDFDLALTLQPCLLLGVSIGVICNRMFPNWLVTSLFAVFLAWSTVKTCKKGLSYWKLESERRSGKRDDGARSPLLVNEGEHEEVRGFPWKKIGVLVIIWLLFFSINLFRGNKYGQIFSLVCFVASLVGQLVVKKVIAKYGRASIIVFAVGMVMALSTVLMTTHGALNVWNDFVSGRYMGFKLPC